MKKCVVCGKNIIESKYMGVIVCSSDCFDKNYWNEHIENKNDLNVARINGFHYIIKDENEDVVFKGSSRRKFTIKFNDGRIVEATNLWQQGAIPDEYRDVLTDNAIFIK